MKLGELIKQVREIVPYSPNIPLKGLTSEKCFVDIELKREELKNKKFQLVRKNQFCYGAGHLSNYGQNILIAHNETETDLALSTTYTSFEVINSEILLPKYLMMWFLRDRFNHLVHWFSEGSHSELFPWQNLCSLPIRVPPPQQQAELVRKYSTVERIIKLKREINETLEKWMEDYYHILFDNLPEEQLEQKKLGELVTVIGGGTPSTMVPEYWTKEGGIPWIGIRDLTKSKNKFISRGERDITEEGFQNSSTKLVGENTILFSCVGNTIGIMGVCERSLCFSQSFFGMSVEIQNIGYIWFLLKNNLQEFNRISLGTTVPNIYKKDLSAFFILFPPQQLIKQFNQACEPFFQLQKANEQEIGELVKLQQYFIEQTN